MKIKTIKIKNFLSIEQADITLDTKKGITLIEGINRDSKTSSSNGSGKSSIFEAIYYALYGKTKRKVSADEVINRHNKKKGTRVEVNLDIMRQDIKIIRCRKDKEFGSAVKVFSDGKDISKGTSADTQEFIESLIKINPLVFERTAFIGQGDVKPFASLTDRELKNTFEDALGLRHLSETHEKAKTYRNMLDHERHSITLNIESKEKYIEMCLEQIEQLKEKIKDVDVYHLEAKKVIENEIKSLKEEKIYLEKMKSTCEAEHGMFAAEFVSAYHDEIEDIRGKLKEFEELKGKLDNKCTDKSREKYSMAEKQNMIKKGKKHCIDFINNAKKKQKKGCPACKRPFDPESILKYITDIKKQYDELELKGKKQAKTLVKITGDIDELKSLYPRLNDKIAALGDDIKQLQIKEAEAKIKKKAEAEKIKETDRKINNCQVKIEEHIDKLTNIDDSFRKKREAINTSKITKEAELHIAEEFLEKIKKDLSTIENSINVANLLCSALSNGGVKSYVFDSVTPALNKDINKSLSTLDPGITAEISTIKRLKSGDIREKFDVKVTNIYGGGSYKSNSGGEKAKVNLAIALAINRLARNMGGDIGFIGLDEPFESLDDQSSEAVVNYLAEIDAKSIFIITHNPAIKDIVSNRIVVEKKNGKAIAKQL